MNIMILDIITNISNFLDSWFMDALKDFLSFIPKLMYFIVACILSLIDLFQVLFRKLAGLDPIMISGDTVTGDSIYKIITDALFSGKYPAINTAFWAIIILGIFMLIVTSIIATIRIEYNPDKDKGNSKSAIISNFLKALFSFAIVPIGCIFGMALANSLIGVIDNITTIEVEQNDGVYTYFDIWNGVSGTDEDNVLIDKKTSYISYEIFGISIPTTAEPFSGAMFKASAYSANRFRLYGNEYLSAVTNSGTDLGIFSTGQIGDYRTAAEIIDTGFAINAKLKGETYSINYTENIKENYFKGGLQLFGSRTNIDHFSKYNVELVWYFYDLWTFNYIVAFASVIIVGKLYFQFCLALMARLFELAGLFLVAPIPIAIMPMDGGGALSKWRGSFVAKFGLIIIMIFGLNIISPILSIINEVKLFNLPLLDNIVLAMFLVAALNAVNSLNNTISTIIFDKNSQYKDSMDLAEKAQGSFQQGLRATIGAGKVATAPVAIAGRAAGTAASFAIKNAIKNGNKKRGKAIDDYENNENKRLDTELSASNAVYDSQEMSEAANAIRYDNSTGLRNYHSMSDEDRTSLADDFLGTAQGQQFVREKFGGNAANAKKAIAENNFSAYGLSSSDSYSASSTIARFAHDRQQFALTKEAADLKEGTAAYNQALGKYAAGSDMDKARAHIGGAPLTATQQSIQHQRRLEETRIQSEREVVAKNAKERREKEERRLERQNSVAKFIGESNERVVKPSVTRTESGLKAVIGTIPGLDMFFGKPKNK